MATKQSLVDTGKVLAFLRICYRLKVTLSFLFSQTQIEQCSTWSFSFFSPFFLLFSFLFSSFLFFSLLFFSSFLLSSFLSLLFCFPSHRPDHKENRMGNEGCKPARVYQ